MRMYPTAHGNANFLSNAIDNPTSLWYNIQAIGVWLSPVECLVRDQEAGGSNPLTPTIPSVHDEYEVMSTRFFCFMPFLSFSDTQPQHLFNETAACC